MTEFIFFLQHLTVEERSGEEEFWFKKEHFFLNTFQFQFTSLISLNCTVKFFTFIFTRLTFFCIVIFSTERQSFLAAEERNGLWK